MRLIKQYRRNISWWMVIFLGVSIHSQINAVLRIAIDIPQSLSKGFANTRDYIINGYSSVHNFGVNHLIMDAINKENKSRRMEKEKPISREFTLIEYNILYLTFMYVNTDKKHIDTIKKALKEAVDEYKDQIAKTKFNFKVTKTAFFESQGPNKFEILQNVLINEGFSDLTRLIDLIKATFSKPHYNIKFSPMKRGIINVGYAKIKSPDEAVIDLLKDNERILDHLKSVDPPKGTADGFTTESKIHLYDGLKRLESYDLLPG